MAKSSAPVSERQQPETLLLDLGHAQVAFGLVVVEGNTQLGEEAQEGPRCGARVAAE